MASSEWGIKRRRDGGFLFGTMTTGKSGFRLFVPDRTLTIITKLICRACGESVVTRFIHEASQDAMIAIDAVGRTCHKCGGTGCEVVRHNPVSQKPQT